MNAPERRTGPATWLALLAAVGIAMLAPSPATAEPLGTWIRTRIPQESGTLLRVRWLNDQFWAMGEAGRLFRSPDGITWTRVATGTEVALEDIALGNGRLVGLLPIPTTSPDLVRGQAVLVSTNLGDTWTRIDLHPPSPVRSSVQLHALGFGSGQFIAVGAAANGTTRGTAPLVQTSPDGLRWTVQPSIAASGSFQVLATDGTDWLIGGHGDPGGGWLERRPLAQPAIATRLHPELYGPLVDIAAGAGLVLALDAFGTQANLSRRGTDLWSKADLPGPPSRGALIACQSAEGTHLILTLDGLYSSTDGRTWLRCLETGTDRLLSIARGPGFWLAVGHGGTVVRSQPGAGPWVELVRSPLPASPQRLTLRAGTPPGHVLQSETSGDLTSWSVVTTVTNVHGTVELGPIDPQTIPGFHRIRDLGAR